jgi:hypothetical protein
MTEEVKPQTRRGRARKEETPEVSSQEQPPEVVTETPEKNQESGRKAKLPNGLTITYH